MAHFLVLVHFKHQNLKFNLWLVSNVIRILSVENQKYRYETHMFSVAIRRPYSAAYVLNVLFINDYEMMVSLHIQSIIPNDMLVL